MASKTSKLMTVLASGAVSLLMAGAAFAAPASASEESSPNGRPADPISERVKADGTAASEGQRGVRPVADSLRSSDGHSALITAGLRKAFSTVGTKASQVKGQARDGLRQVV